MQSNPKVFAAIENNKPAYYRVPVNAIVMFDNKFKRVILVDGKEINPEKIDEVLANQMGCVSVKQDEYSSGKTIWFLKRRHASEPEMKTSNPDLINSRNYSDPTLG